jgi:hypothetical protein
MPCRSCKEPMVGIEFTKHYRIVCDNSRCNLYREGQNTIEKQLEPETINTLMAPLPKIPSPRGPNSKKTVRRKGLEYDRKTF